MFARTPRRNLRRGDEGDVHLRRPRRRFRSPCAPKRTAGVCRALVTNGLTQSLPQKVFYAGPMFRYERPQKGRYRQFHQIGIELIGPAEPLADAEVIACGWDILQALGVADDTVLELNTLGDKAQPRRLPRRAGRAISPHIGTRFARTAWPGSTATRCASSTARTRPTAARRRRPDHRRLSDRGRRTLLREAAGPPGPVPRAVRGKPAHRPRPRLLRPHRLRIRHHQARRPGHRDGRRPLRRAGRGDGRPADPRRRLGRGHRAPGHADAPNRPPRRARSPSSRSATRPRRRRSNVLQSLRHAGIRAEMAYRGNLKRRMERANRTGARAAVILGDDDIANGVAQVKDLATGAQEAIPFSGSRRAAEMNLALETRPHRRPRRGTARAAVRRHLRRSLRQGVEGTLRHRAGGRPHRRPARRRTRADRGRVAAGRPGNEGSGRSRTVRTERTDPGAGA